MQLHYRNVNYALPEIVDEMLEQGDFGASRNGPVLSIPEPVTVTTMKPMERVLLCPVRRANPFLNLIDGLSIFSTNNNLRPFTDIVKRFANYSDDGKTLRAHYGRRIGFQLMTAVDMLRRDPDSRRVVMSIWDVDKDLDVVSKDIPCNVMMMPRIVRGARLDLTVINRSNDLFWGMLGANIVQFSFLQEFMARCLGKEIGQLHQISTNLHAYTEFGPGQCFRGIESIDDEKWNNPFTRAIQPYPPSIPLDIVHLRVGIQRLFEALSNGETPPFTGNEFIDGVVRPMLASWRDKSDEPLKDYPNCDWFEAARMWWRKA